MPRGGYGAAPPASRVLRIALRATALRAAPDSGDLGGPPGRKQGQARACPSRERGTSCDTEEQKQPGNTGKHSRKHGQKQMFE